MRCYTARSACILVEVVVASFAVCAAEVVHSFTSCFFKTEKKVLSAKNALGWATRLKEKPVQSEGGFIPLGALANSGIKPVASTAPETKPEVEETVSGD